MTTPAQPISSGEKSSFYHKAALFCLLAPFIGVFLTHSSHMHPAPPTPGVDPRIDALANAIVNGAVPVLGALSGLIALSGMGRYGRERILWRSVIGLTLFLFLVLAAIPPFLKAREVARQRAASSGALQPSR